MYNPITFANVFKNIKGGGGRFNPIKVNPLILYRAGRCTPNPPLVFCPLLKISLGNPYLNILDLAKLFAVDALNKISKFSVLHPLKALDCTDILGYMCYCMSK